MDHALSDDLFLISFIFYYYRDLSFNNITGLVPEAMLGLNSLNFLYGFSCLLS